MLLPERLLKTNRFPGFSAPTMNRFAVFGDVEKSSILGYLLQTLRDPHTTGCTSKSQNAHSKAQAELEKAETGRDNSPTAPEFFHLVKLMGALTSVKYIN